MNDIARRGLNLVLPPLMWICSSLGFIFEGARSPADMSDTNTSLLVPFGAAFSIWLPIFALCICYGIIQALPKNKDNAVFKQLGPWSAAGFAGVCLWGIINAFAPMQPVDLAQWGTAIIFVPTMLLLVKAMLIITPETDKLTGATRLVTWLGLSLIAGWCSIAVFLNWTPQMVGIMTSAGLGLQSAHIIMLALALVWAVFIIRKSGGNRAYAFPIIWGLAFVIIKRVTTEPNYMAITVGALLGILILIAACVIRPKTRTPKQAY